MAVTWNPALLDTVLAPGISTFTEANIPNLSPEFPLAPHSMANNIYDPLTIDR